MFVRLFLSIDKYLYTMFASKFYTLLEHDIMSIGMSPQTNPHHRVALRGIARKKQTQIPDIHKSTGHPTERKIIMVKDAGGSQPCNNNDIQYFIKGVTIKGEIKKV